MQQSLSFKNIVVKVHNIKFNLLILFKCSCMLSHFSCVRLLVTPWTVACQAPPSIHGIFQARILEWAAIPSSRRFS